jgi:hypothetical protein
MNSPNAVEEFQPFLSPPKTDGKDLEHVVQTELDLPRG